MSLISALIAVGTVVLAEHSITAETFRTCQYDERSVFVCKISLPVSMDSGPSHDSEQDPPQ